jgi:peptide-methionine (S)-S-oxide reductase
VKRILTSLFCAAALGACAPSWADEPARALPAPTVDMPASHATSETAVLAGGCFWGMEGVFEHVRGVTRVRSGYSGGQAVTAHYEIVSTGVTGHAESVEIVFDPRIISYGQILRLYFSVATDPTQLNRQGPDTGTQYRGDIFVANADQERVARAYIAQLTNAHTYAHPIVTRVDRLTQFYPAEAHHQDFLELNPDYPYIVYNDLPKLANLQRLFPSMYRTTTTRVAS